jgi:hypothetical protein
MKDEKKSILKEALVEYNEIMQAADANAKKKLAEEFPEKFGNLLKEELQKNKNKSVKESYKKIDDVQESNELDKSESKKESVMKKETKETKKVANEQAGEGKPFDEKAKGLETVKEEREKEFMGDLEPETPNKAKDAEMEKGNAFKDKIHGPTSGKPMSNITEEFDITELDGDNVGSAIESADAEDEFLTMEELEAEIAQMEDLGEELNTVDENESDPFTELVNMRNKLDEMIKNLNVGEQKSAGGKQNFPARNAMGNDGGHAGITTDLIDEHHLDKKEDKISFVASSLENMDDATVDKIYRSVENEMGISEQQKHGGRQSIPGRESGGPTSAMIDEESPITDADVEAVLGSSLSEEEVDETLDHTITHSNARQAGAHNHTNYGKESRLRYAMREGEQNVKSLIEENKKLTKKLNEGKKYKESVSTLVESYKTALEKYRNQLKEMAIFNTNLAHVNNLLVNEELALTQEDKIKIINEFKNVNTITESQSKYKTFLTEMKESKKTLTESISGKAAASIAPSSKQKLDEVVEKTAYENDEHINKMKRLIEYVEKRGKKNNL